MMSFFKLKSLEHDKISEGVMSATKKFRITNTTTKKCIILLKNILFYLVKKFCFVKKYILFC